ncbi:zinc finger protein zas1 [Podospora australis]|uniref:Zinc finger protein zas1 n=1 Tax=Podospora australis TaxID=1536484 RepID=A0AAN7AEH3_9PEZI|nr:zinc finger protein zas1 [Podospora australis]
MPASPPPAFAGKRFECNIPGCGRSFTRKEHLTRHAKSHSARPQYQCPLCGKRYARSDVLKRHVEFHPQNTSTRRRTPACVSCHEKKIKCDGNKPCQICVQKNIECAQQVSTILTPESDDGQPSSGITLGTAPEADIPPAETANLSPQATSLPGATDAGNEGFAWVPSNHKQRQQEWFQAQFDWSSPTNLFMSSPDINAQRQSSGLDSSTLGGNVATVPTFPDSNSYRSEQVQQEFGLATLDDVAHTLSATIGTPPLLQNATTPTSSSVSTDTTIPPPYETLHSIIQKDEYATRELVQIFFRENHPYWPILHAPTFDISSASDLLLGSMLTLASWTTARAEHRILGPVLFRELMAATEVDVTPSLHTLQALLLYVVYATYNMNERLIGKATRANAILHMSCRCLGIFNGSHNLPDRLQDRAFTFWLAKEQLHRLAYAVFRVDTYLNVLLNGAPSVRYQELCVPLLKSARLWAAQNEEERRRIQWAEPSGREKALFSCLMRDALLLHEGTEEQQPCLPYNLHGDDYHLGLCALQAGVWEAAVEAHSFGTDEIVTKLVPGSPLKRWRAHLDGWKERMEKDCAVEGRFYSDGYSASSTLEENEEERAIAPITLVLWHMSKIKMHAPISLLRLHSSIRSKQQQHYLCGTRSGAFEQVDTAKVSARVRVWFQSNCPRIAVWSAAQILRVLERENGGSLANMGVKGPPKNPLAVASILMSAIVVCSYASGIKACDQCTPGGMFDAGSCVDLFSTDATPESTLLGWVEDGRGWAIWGPTGALLCQCGRRRLGEFFDGVLNVDKVAKEDFRQFFQGLVD